jgi:UDP-N-acetylmuramate--alanine ligase
MLDFNKIHNVYLVGIGGIGMSALARYFKILGKFVAGYDKNPTDLTKQLISEGIDIHFEDNLSLVPEQVLSQKDTTLVIYTPAIPNYHYEFNYFHEREYLVLKRAEVLGLIFSNRKGIAVAGTHGKTTTSTMIAHILKQSAIDCNAFLGGISKNYNSNLLLSEKSDIIVTEADEFDRSFLKLYPHLAVVTSVDADHLDVYGNKEEVIKSFNKFVNQIATNGILIYKKGISLSIENVKSLNVFTYSATEEADFFPFNISMFEGLYRFDVQTPLGQISDITLGIPGIMNLENAIASIAATYLLEAKPAEIRKALADFKGVKRRFEYHIKTPQLVYIDDYAHHPEEIKACITSVRKIFSDKHITGVFQPHLYTRTRDFADGFAESLNLLDELILLDIYPAREQSIEGVSSEMILKNVTIRNKSICKKEQLLDVLKTKQIEILITMGAGDIDKFVEPIKSILMK